jgi:hypothetical protein
MITDEHIIVDATLQPFEFVLLALDVIHDQELELSDPLEHDAHILQGGFRLQFVLGATMLLTLEHDEETACFIASIGAEQPTNNSQLWKIALSLNNLMPQERRFAIDASTNGLILKETWKAAGLDLTNFAIGLRSLINIMRTFLNSEIAVPAPEQTPNASYIRV